MIDIRVGKGCNEPFCCPHDETHEKQIFIVIEFSAKFNEFWGMLR